MSSILVNWHVNEHGVIEGAGFHDGLFHGIDTDKNNLVRIFLTDYKGAARTVELIDVSLINLKNYWGINIVGDLHLWSISDVSRHFVEELITDRQILMEEVEFRTMYAGKLFFYLSSSYGADIAAVCKNLIIL